MNNLMGPSDRAGGDRGKAGTSAYVGLSHSGSAAVELVILTPLLILLVASVLLAGRLYLAKAQLEDATRAGLESAITWPTPADARLVARETILSELAADNLSCSQLGIAVDTGSFAAGGTLTVSVTCTLALGAARPPGVSPAVTITDTATGPVELYREVG